MMPTPINRMNTSYSRLAFGAKHPTPTDQDFNQHPFEDWFWRHRLKQKNHASAILVSLSKQSMGLCDLEDTAEKLLASVPKNKQAVWGPTPEFKLGRALPAPLKFFQLVSFMEAEHLIEVYNHVTNWGLFQQDKGLRYRLADKGRYYLSQAKDAFIAK